MQKTSLLARYFSLQALFCLGMVFNALFVLSIVCFVIWLYLLNFQPETLGRFQSNWAIGMMMAWVCVFWFAGTACYRAHDLAIVSRRVNK